MTRFSDHVLAGEPVTADEWRENLLEFHRKYPAATSNAFGGLFDANGRTSYEILADSALRGGRQPARILDVGCGDGTLLAILRRRVPSAELYGIDLCEEDVIAARARLSVGTDCLVVADAARMPFPDASFDLVVSHLALMLIPDVAPVIAEIRRVIAPGGRLVFVTDDPAAVSGDLLEAFRTVYKTLVADHPHLGRVIMADSRVYDSAATDTLLASLGFPAFPEHAGHEIASSVDAEALYQFVGATYFVGMLEDELLERVRSGMSMLCQDGPLRIALPIRLTTVDC